MMGIVFDLNWQQQASESRKRLEIQLQRRIKEGSRNNKPKES
jgi:hypothetical protein